MRAKHVGAIAVVLLIVVAATAGLTGWALFSVPTFYSSVEIPDRAVREEAAKQFVAQTQRLVEEIRRGDAWSEQFTQTQINSWLIEDLPRQRAVRLPRGIDEPRVQFDGNVLNVGFRLEHPQFDGVVSMRLRPYVPTPNRLAVEIQSVKAGLLPIPLKEILTEITRQFDRQGWETRWTENDGHDTLLVELDRGKPGQPVLEVVEVVDGSLRISGSRPEAAIEPVSYEQFVPRLANQPRRR